MAKARRRLSPADFDAVRGTANDVKAFRKYVEQEGAAARELVDDVIARGAARMKKAAWLCLAELDLLAAEARALDALVGIAGKKPKKDVIEPLLLVATTACLDRYEALGLEVLPDSLADQAFVRAQSWAIAKMLRCPEPEGQDAVLEEWFPHYRRVPNTLALLREVVRSPQLLARRRVFQILIEGRDLETCRGDDLPEEFTIDARFALPPEEAFERLKTFFEANPVQRDAVIRTLKRQKVRDPRWVELFASIDDEALRSSGLLATGRPEALPYLAPLIRNMAPGPALLEALMDLRGFDSPEAAELLLPWLERSELDGNAALLSTSLRACGTPAHEAALQAAASRNPSGAMFYLEAISHIQARHRLPL